MPVANVPFPPMEAQLVRELPRGDGWQFEPKWDGFRTLVFRDGDEVLLQSRDEKPMNRYFPELVAPLAAALPESSSNLAFHVAVGGGVGLGPIDLTLEVGDYISGFRMENGDRSLQNDFFGMVGFRVGMF